jgi:hypothetical protein
MVDYKNIPMGKAMDAKRHPSTKKKKATQDYMGHILPSRAIPGPEDYFDQMTNPTYYPGNPNE